MTTPTTGRERDVICAFCNENWLDIDNDPAIETTWQQWQCPACGRWNDLPAQSTEGLTGENIADALNCGELFLSDWHDDEGKDAEGAENCRAQAANFARCKPLFLAALDMREALEGVIALLHDGGDEQIIPGDLAQDIRAAIDKAGTARKADDALTDHDWEVIATALHWYADDRAECAKMESGETRESSLAAEARAYEVIEKL